MSSQTTGSGICENLFISYQKHLASEVELSAWDVAELGWRRFAYFSFCVYVIAIGCPIWYATTTPHRAKLPVFGESYRTEIREFFLSENITPDFNSVNGSDEQQEVWLQATLSPRYNVHVIFVMDVTSSAGDFEGAPHASTQWRGNEGVTKFVAELLEGMRQFLHLFANSVEVDMTTEHLFDFSLAEFLDTESSAAQRNIDGAAYCHSLVVQARNISALSAEIDRLSLPPVTSADPILKIVVIVPSANSTVRFIDEHLAPTDGLAVASWGGFVSSDAALIAETLNSIFTIFRLEMGVESAKARVSRSPIAARLVERCRLMSGRECPMPLADASHHKLLAAMVHISRCIDTIDSLHDLVAKQKDLVISDEVARLANDAYDRLQPVYEQLIQKHSAEFDALPSLRARLLAESAITHPSLLEFLNFPSDQKVGIYIPLFFPVAVPILTPLAVFTLFAVRRMAAERNKRNAEIK